MSKILSIWAACRVRRWHTNWELAGTDDRIDGHSARVQRIILALHPAPTMALMVAALVHDDGEYAVGDIPQPAKAAMRSREPEAWERFEAAEDDALAEVWAESIDRLPHITYRELLWLKFADRLDAYIWAKMHGARMDRNGWPDALAWLEQTSRRLGSNVRAELVAYLEAAA